MARMPASGPSLIKMTKKIAHTMLAAVARVRKVTGFGFKFLAAARESGDHHVPNTGRFTIPM